MEDKYFNVWEFKQAFSSSKNNPQEAKEKYEEYLKKYPEDYTSYTFYISLLINLGELDKAQQTLDFVEESAKKDCKFSELSKVEYLKRNLLFDKIKLFAYREKYDELYYLYLNNLQELSNFELNHLIFLCKNKLGLINKDRIEINTYLFRQIVQYSEEDFLDHIQKHLADYNKDLDNPNKHIFVPNFPIYNIIKEIKQYIPSEKKVCNGLIENTYFFKYNNCGRANNKLVDHFKVTCFHNTANFITMCPAENCENLPHVDLNYLNHSNENIKVRRLSQIEKFNKRFKQ